MGYKRILVAIDRSPQSDIIFEQALEQAKKDKAKLMLFHCLDLETQGALAYGPTGFGNYVTGPVGYGTMGLENQVELYQLTQERFGEEVKEIGQWLNAYCERAKAEGIETEFDWRQGDAGRSIRELAKSWNADLVIIGRRGRSGIEELILGSVSNYVVHHVSCSVLVVQDTPKTDPIPSPL